MTKGPWKYQKANGHHHVLIGKKEVLDVNSEANAKAIALLPTIIKLHRRMGKLFLQIGDLLKDIK